jgi:predicted Zn-ribbon and HTH transcriptional regulator
MAASWTTTKIEHFSKCERCGHSWKRRSEKLPKTCPKCRSPYWDKERVRK